jgi:hypothetical protein
VRNPISLSLFLLCGRNRLDHTKRLEPGELGHQRHLAARRRFEREEADLVLGTWIDRPKETRAPLRVISSAAERARRSRA